MSVRETKGQIRSQTSQREYDRKHGVVRQPDFCKGSRDRAKEKQIIARLACAEEG